MVKTEAKISNQLFAARVFTMGFFINPFLMLIPLYLISVFTLFAFTSKSQFSITLFSVLAVAIAIVSIVGFLKSYRMLTKHNKAESSLKEVTLSLAKCHTNSQDDKEIRERFTQEITEELFGLYEEFGVEAYSRAVSRIIDKEKSRQSVSMRSRIDSIVSGF